MLKDHRQLRLSASNMDIYFPLKKKVDIISIITEKYFQGKLLDIGCGEMPYKNMVLDINGNINYIGVDIHSPIYKDRGNPDFFWDGKELPFDDDSINCSMLIEVLEHIPDPYVVLNESKRVLKKGGLLLITVPFLWTLHDVPHDEYRYTPFALRRIVEEIGFEVVHIESLGSWFASFAYSIALFSRRKLIGVKSKIACHLSLPFVKYLIKKDEKANHAKFSEGEMITGIWCLVKKK
jgi:SAM-dependent methyltransferase